MRDGWEIKKLGEVCTKLTDGSHNPPKGVAHSNYMMLSSQNVFNDKIILDDVRFLQEDDFLREDKRTCVRKGDVLLTIVGTVGRCAVFTGATNITLQRSVAVLRSQENVVPRYLMHCLIARNASLNENAHGIAQKGIYLRQLSQIPIPVPPLAEQERIVAELDLLSGIIEKQKQQLKEYDTLAQSIFYTMFGNPITNEKGWEVKKLEEVCNKITDGTHDTPERLSSGVKFITGKHIRAGIIDYENSDYVSKDVHDEIYARCNPEFGDVLYTNIGANLGTAAINIVSYEFSMKNIALLKANKNIINGYYLQSYLNDEEIKKDIINCLSNGGAQKFLSLKMIAKICINLPPLLLQQEFAKKIEAIEKQKKLIKQSLTETEALFKSRMDYYFN
ncbi:MAG: restriction endonuclease subunit S [Bacteroidaceae bacterium]|nr:restriction endonuclease subunit S [Bacteroidaceae bacterium]